MSSATRTQPQTARDLMRSDVVTLRPQDTLQTALDQIVENHVSGLPVLDSSGRCVGVISMSDILGFEQRTGESAAGENTWAERYFNESEHRWEAFGLAAFAVEQSGDRRVADLMSEDLVSVTPDTPLESVASMMLEHQIHRILVMDDDQHLCGIISSFDFVRLST